MKDDTTNLTGDLFEFFPLWSLPASDTSLSVVELVAETAWLDPATLSELIHPHGDGPLLPETGTEAFLEELLDFVGAALPESGTLTVNWGDGTAVEVFGRNHKFLKAEHSHAFAHSGQYRVLIAAKGPSAAPDFFRLILQVHNEVGEITAYRALSME